MGKAWTRVGHRQRGVVARGWAVFALDAKYTKFHTTCLQALVLLGSRYVSHAHEQYPDPGSRAHDANLILFYKHNLS